MINSKKVEMAISSKIVNLTKYEMNKNHSSKEIAYKKIITSELGKLLQNPKTGLYLEPIAFIYEAYDLEMNYSKEKMLEYVRKE